MQSISYKNVEINNGYFYLWQKRVGCVTLPSIHKVFYNTRFKAINLSKKFKIIKKKKFKNQLPHIFWDSDVAKWLEACSYYLKYNTDDNLKHIVEKTIDDIIKKQEKCGYFNSHFQLLPKSARFKNRDAHELYCVGHLMEAAVAYYDYCGNDRFIKAMNLYTDYIIDRFVNKKDTNFISCGHPEIELALIRVYKLTKEEKYLKLARFFIDNRGSDREKPMINNFPVYEQSHMPLREQKEALGHSVRALYMYKAMADMSIIDNDNELKVAVEAIWDNIINKKMYVIGGVGSQHEYEAFSYDYFLPNSTAYAETCANIALVFFADSLSNIDNSVHYQDVLERALYNGCMSGISMDGKAFFYINPLEVDTEFIKYAQDKRLRATRPDLVRKEVFDCSCCPPNIARVICSVGEYIYKSDESNHKFFINQYISNNMLTAIDGVKINMQSAFPYSGKVDIRVLENNNLNTLCLRVPYWCDKVDITINDKAVTPSISNGYITINGNINDKITLDFDMKLKKVFASNNVKKIDGKTALSYGPLILCAESVDNENIFGVTLDINTYNTEFIDIKGDKNETYNHKNIKITESTDNTLDKNNTDDNIDNHNCDTESNLSRGLDIDKIFRIKVKASYDANTELYHYNKDIVSTDYYLIPYAQWANRGYADMKIWHDVI